MDRMFWKMLASGVAAGAGYFLYHSLQRAQGQGFSGAGVGSIPSATHSELKPDLTAHAETPVSTTPIDPSGMTH